MGPEGINILLRKENVIYIIWFLRCASKTKKKENPLYFNVWALFCKEFHFCCISLNYNLIIVKFIVCGSKFGYFGISAIDLTKKYELIKKLLWIIGPTTRKININLLNLTQKNLVHLMFILLRLLIFKLVKDKFLQFSKILNPLTIKSCSDSLLLWRNLPPSVKSLGARDLVLIEW